jgi:hypothetical protein
MKKVNVMILCVLVVIIATVAINYYLAHKTRYLDLKYYDIYTESFPYPAYMELGNGLRLKRYPDKTMFNDEQIIKKVLDYLNSIPLVYVTEREYNANVSSENLVYIKFYNERKDATSYVTINGQEYMVMSENSIGRVDFRDDEYIQDSRTMQAYKVRHEGTKIITKLEELDLEPVFTE